MIPTRSVKRHELTETRYAGQSAPNAERHAEPLVESEYMGVIWGGRRGIWLGLVPLWGVGEGGTRTIVTRRHPREQAHRGWRTLEWSAGLFGTEVQCVNLSSRPRSLVLSISIIDDSTGLGGSSVTQPRRSELFLGPLSNGITAISATRDAEAESQSRAEPHPATPSSLGLFSSHPPLGSPPSTASLQNAFRPPHPQWRVGNQPSDTC